MRKQHYAVIAAISLLSLTWFAERAAAPHEAEPPAKSSASEIGSQAAQRSIPYTFSSGKKKDPGREVNENGLRGIEISLDEVQPFSTGYVHPYYRYTPVEIVPLTP